jgi:hypothetical protein
LQLAAPEVRARLPNTLPCVAVALLAGSLAACGGSSSPSTRALLSQTFASSKPIESGRIDLTFALSAAAANGVPAPRGSFSLHLTGPFQSAGVGRFPHFVLALTVVDSGQTVNVGATSTAARLYLELGGVPFLAPDSTVRALEQGYAQATAQRSASNASSANGSQTFATLGVDPGLWLTHPTVAGSAKIAGEDTVHIAAGLDLRCFLADARKLSSAGGALGVGGAGGPGGLISGERLTALSASVRAGRVDVYTGTRDHLLRRLALRAEVSPSA